jgi:hypothetical protein
LPLDLSPFGAPGCAVLASLDVAVPASVSSGQLKATFVVPVDTNLLGANIYHQCVHVWTTPLGLATTNGVRVRVGGE